MIDSDGEIAKEVAVWTGSMWWLPAIDGALPIGDIIFAVTTAGVAITLAWTGRKYVKVSYAATKAHKKIKATVRRNSKVRYWSATIRAGYVDIGRPLTYSQAVKEVKAGRSVFTVTSYEAKAVALAAGGKTGKNNKKLQPEIDRGKTTYRDIIGIIIRIIGKVDMCTICIEG